MIDVHCHLEQKDYDADRDAVVAKCKAAGIKALITVCAHPNDFEKTMQIIAAYPNFVFAIAAIHPEYIKDIKQAEIDAFFEILKQNKKQLIGIGEAGLDYFWVKEPEWQLKQKQLFIQFIDLAKQLKKPLTVHTRDAHDDVVKVLEQEDARDVHLHMWGDNHLVKRIIELGYHVSVGPIIERSKKHKKVVRDITLDRLFLETDSPWFGKVIGTTQEGKLKRERGDPTNARIPAEKIAEIKKISVEEVIAATTSNAVGFWRLPVKP